MAGNSLKISTEQVMQIAAELERLNKQLKGELTTSKQTIDNLTNIWEGSAAQETVSNFDQFSRKFFDKYEAVIDQYVKFLRQNVAEGYVQVETQNKDLGSAFK